MSRDLLAGLDDGQREAVLAPSGPVCVLAGAGTGKTRTITHRIARLVTTGRHAVDEVLAVTFTTRAAGEMRGRLAQLGVAGVQARTFHSAALRQLRFFWPRAIGGQMWPLAESRIRLVGSAARRCGIDPDRALLRDLTSEIEWAKAMVIPPEGYSDAVRSLHRDPPVGVTDMVRLYHHYERIKADARQLDFDDLLLQTAAILEEDGESARTFGARYRYFVVDEYQDVTPLQQRLLDAWLGGRDHLTVVGDAQQTIYSFAGASPQYLIEFPRRYPGATVVRLAKDYRSTPQVVEVANRIIGAATGPTARLRLTLRAALADGPPVTFDEYPDEPAEAAAVAARISDMIDAGTPASTIAVLYRINAQSEVYEQALADRHLPYVVRGSERFFTRPEVRAAIRAITTAARSAPEGTDLVPAVRTVLGPVGLSQGPPAPGAQRERWETLSALVSIAEEMAAVDTRTDLAAFAQELVRRAEEQHSPVIDGVTLASLHAAKGLEWDAVFLTGLADGTLPIVHADSASDIEEERRLLYVGVTRARTRLALSWALARHPGGRATRRRSRFLDGIAPAAPAPQRAVRRHGRCSICGGGLLTAAQRRRGRCGTCPSPADPTLVAALKQWRKERASADSVPAFVVLTDATVEMIAEQRPTDDVALLAVRGIGHGKLDRYGREILEIVTRVR